MSAAERRKGNAAEVEVCAALGRLDIPAVTSRNARGGSQQGVDIVAPGLPVAIEVKNQSRDSLPSWVDQARRQAGPLPGAVIHKRRGKARAEEWFVTMQVDDFVRLIRPDMEF
jgi:hypothetical protein